MKVIDENLFQSDCENTPFLIEGVVDRIVRDDCILFYKSGRCVLWIKETGEFFWCNPLDGGTELEERISIQERPHNAQAIMDEETAIEQTTYDDFWNKPGNNIAGCPGCMDSDKILEGHAYCHPASTEWQKLWDEEKADVRLENSTWRIFVAERRILKMLYITVITNCRRTGSGAYTTMNCPSMNHSKSGNHWQEIQQISVNSRLLVIDISNSGKHNCFRVRVRKDGKVVKISDNTMIDQYHCVTCDEVDRSVKESEIEEAVCVAKHGDTIEL